MQEKICISKGIKGNKGFSLLEILISLAIFSFSFMGIASLFWAVTQNTYQHFFLYQAEWQLMNEAELRWVSKGSGLGEWERENKVLFPGGQSKSNSNNLFISWQTSRGEPAFLKLTL